MTPPSPNSLNWDPFRSFQYKIRIRIVIVVRPARHCNVMVGPFDVFCIRLYKNIRKFSKTRSFIPLFVTLVAHKTFITSNPRSSTFIELRLWKINTTFVQNTITLSNTATASQSYKRCSANQKTCKTSTDLQHCNKHTKCK